MVPFQPNYFKPKLTNSLKMMKNYELFKISNISADFCPKVIKRLLMLYTSNIAQSLSEISNIFLIILVSNFE